MVTPVVNERRRKLAGDSSCFCDIAYYLRDRIFSEIRIDRCVLVSISLTEFELGIESVLVFLIGDHLEIVHLLEDHTLSSLGVSSAGFS